MSLRRSDDALRSEALEDGGTAHAEQASDRNPTFRDDDLLAAPDTVEVLAEMGSQNADRDIHT